MLPLIINTIVLLYYTIVFIINDVTKSEYSEIPPKYKTYTQQITYIYNIHDIQI